MEYVSPVLSRRSGDHTRVTGEFLVVLLLGTMIVVARVWFLRALLVLIINYFKRSNTFSYLRGDSFIAKHVLKGIAIGEIVRTLRNTSCPRYFRMIKRILILKCYMYRRGFPSMAIQATKKIVFRMKNEYLEPSKKIEVSSTPHSHSY